MVKRSYVVAGSLVVAAGLFAAGCEQGGRTDSNAQRSEPGAGPRTGEKNPLSEPPVGGGPAPSKALTARTAAQSMAQVRCDLEAKCKNIGADSKYKTREQCVNDEQSKSSDDLGGSDCPKGVDQNKLDRCLSEIRGAQCENPVDAISKNQACRKDELCIR